MEFCVSDANRIFIHTHIPRPVKRLWQILSEYYHDADGSPMPPFRILAHSGLRISELSENLCRLEEAGWVQVLSSDGGKRFVLGMPATAAILAERGEQLSQGELAGIGAALPFPTSIRRVFIAVRPDPITVAA